MVEASDIILDLGDGLIVRRHRKSDAPSLSRHGSNPNVKKYLRAGFPHPYTEKDALAWMERCSQPENMLSSGEWTPEKGAQGPKTVCHYAIVINDEAVGAIGLSPYGDVYFRSAELGYWLSEDYWGKGIMSRVAKAFVDWTWTTFGILVRLNSGSDGDNLGSQAVLKKAGFVYEGRRESAVYKSGRLVAETIYGLLRPT